MKVKVLTVHWHADSQPIYSASFQPCPENDDDNKRQQQQQQLGRFATAGGDNNVRIWTLIPSTESAGVGVNYLSTLSRHTQAVNVVRWSPRGDLLASAGDDGSVLLWALSDTAIVEFGSESSSSSAATEDPESWKLLKSLRTSVSEIYDLAWSPCGQFIVTGSMDNVARVYNVQTAQCVREISQHGHYVQGVAWDPLGQFIATQSSDRSVGVHKITNKGVKGGLVISDSTRVSKVDLPVKVKSDDMNTTESKAIPTYRPAMLYHNETFTSFFRRLTFSPDGSLLFTPSGIFKYIDEKAEDSITTTSTNTTPNTDTTNTVFIFTRAGLTKPPVAQLPGLKKPSLAVKFSPILYKLDMSFSGSVFELPYRMVYAVATQDSVIIYDTQRQDPLALVSNLHYATYTDLAWSPDGRVLLMTSTDGFCSVVEFELEELGIVYSESELDRTLIKPVIESKSVAASPESIPELEIKTPELTPELPSLDKIEDKKSKPVESILKFTNVMRKESADSVEKQSAGSAKKRRIAPTFISTLDR